MKSEVKVRERSDGAMTRLEEGRDKVMDSQIKTLIERAVKIEESILGLQLSRD